MIFNVSGGGGTALNFRVVGGTTAPTNPAENCIWVNTDTPITSWIFSATEPSPAEAGMVWISTGTSSLIEFNALKKNGIQIYPLSAKQYVSGKWVDKTAKSYQGGKLVDWPPSGALYWDGGQVVEWIAKTSLGTVAGWPIKAPTFSEKTMDLAADGSDTNTVCGIVTKNKVDITGFSKLIVEFESTSGVAPANTVHVHITNIQTENWEGASSIAKTDISANTPKVELPFTGSGLYYIDIHLMRGAKVSIKRIWLE